MTKDTTHAKDEITLLKPILDKVAMPGCLIGPSDLPVQFWLLRIIPKRLSANKR